MYCNIGYGIELGADKFIQYETKISTDAYPYISQVNGGYCVLQWQCYTAGKDYIGHVC